jgi:rhamnosyltransferase subunit B
MQFYLGAFGSAGDVHPMIGIGKVLQARGHDVALVTSNYFEPMVRRAGLDLLDPNPEFDYRTALQAPDLWHPIRSSRVLFSLIEQAIEPMYRLVRRLHVPGRTAFVGSSLSLGMRVAQAAHGIPLASVHLSPCFFRSRTDGPKFYGLYRPEYWPGFMKDGAYRLIDKYMIDPRLAPTINRLLAAQNKSPAESILGSWLHSPELTLALFPGWFTAPKQDWPQQTVVTQFPLYDEADAVQPAPEVEEFVCSGSAPIVFTPGSANIQSQAGRFFKAAADSCRRLKRRGILLTRFSEQVPKQLPEGVQHFDFVPFSWLLPKAAAIVHHGGIGTLSQGLAAGIPQLLMPMNFDQHDNAHRLKKLGCGASLPTWRFRGAAVAGALSRLLISPQVTTACSQAARQMMVLKPLESICDALERFARRNSSTALPVEE